MKACFNVLSARSRLEVRLELCIALTMSKIGFWFAFQYKTERDGVVETHVEQKITIQSDGDPIDHDKALAEAIQEATLMNPDMTVEKIEIQQQSATGAPQ